MRGGAKRAIELDKNDIAAYKILSNLYTRQGRTDLASRMNEEAIHANGRVAAAYPFVPDKQITVEHRRIALKLRRRPATPKSF